MTEAAKRSEHLLWALQERAKELGCLYDVEELLKATETPLDEVFRGVIRAIPPGWQYPDICDAKVEYEEQVFTSDGLQETPWKQGADIVVQDRTVGRITVYYRQEMPLADEGPFLKEEAKLIRTIADRVGHFILHQRLHEIVHEWRSAEAAPSGQGTPEWRTALNFVKRTDQDLFLRISRKMANYLSWSGVAEAQTIVQGFGREQREAESAMLGEQNVPIKKMPISDSLELADRVFTVARTRISDADILGRIQKWIQEDRSAFFVRTILDAQSSPAEIAEAIRRHHHLLPPGSSLSPETQNAVKVALIHRFLSGSPEYVRVAKEVMEMDDMRMLLERLIYPHGSRGRMGGKNAGLFLAGLVLRREARENAGLSEVRVPKTWYIASDAVLAFIRQNNLEEVYEQKYKEIDQVRAEYPHLVQVFKNSQFPPEIVKGLSMALDELHDSPLIVRSSSLLEDRLGAAFSGKYKSLFLANVGTKRERLAALMDAIAEVYASVFGPDPIYYRAERGMLDVREEMGILIQEVVGVQVGKCYMPAYAGVAFSNNEFRWSPRISREDGLIRIVPGLGTRAVDRVREDYPILLAPGQPGLRVNVTPEEVVRYSPQRIDVINLESRSVETLDFRKLLRECGAEYPQIHRLVSLCDGSNITKPATRLLDFERGRLAVTFEGLISDTGFVSRVDLILKTLQARLGHAVDIEFASDGTDFYLLQCRPQSYSKGSVPSPIPKDVPRERILFTASRYVSNGTVPDITHVVYVDPDEYAAADDFSALVATGRAVGRLNLVLPKRQFILMGPGRWGSRGDIKLGVNVTYADINNTAMLIEMARKRGGYLPDLSFGTHFFQDLVEASIRYLPIYPDDEGIVFNERFFRSSPNELAGLVPELGDLSNIVRVIDVQRATGGKVLRVLMNADLDEAVGMLVEPGRPAQAIREMLGSAEVVGGDHWRWRLRMAERIAEQLDARRFGVEALYVIGSTKNAAAGPGSDIDLLVHFRGTPEQRQALSLWLEGWSFSLDEVNYLRTGYRRGGLLDIHFVTDEDIAQKSSYAIKIGAVTDPAWKLSLRSG